MGELGAEYLGELGADCLGDPGTESPEVDAGEFGAESVLAGEPGDECGSGELGAGDLAIGDRGRGDLGRVRLAAGELATGDRGILCCGCERDWLPLLGMCSFGGGPIATGLPDLARLRHLMQITSPLGATG